ncbi:MAG: UDP-N-acetylmuramate dehydrogenase, partial [Desulfatirhabdiaceae bacterium]|nr:UDP-N-acetylmuramate dehydrogenase [Desulfatirhabdiaceae bacterium]
LRVGGPAEVFVEPKTTDELAALVSGLAGRKIPYHVLGGGTNLIVTDAGISGVVICMKPCKSEILIENTSASEARVTVMAGTSLRFLCSHAIHNGLKGMNFALGIPGTVGGAIRMNAGTALGWISDVIESVTVLYPNGLQETIGRNALCFSYRKLMLPQLSCEKTLSHETIIISGSFSLVRASCADLKQEAGEIMKNRKRLQPTMPSAGCIFKNPLAGKTAGELIDLCGLKGQKIGGAKISEKHANFIVNSGSAAAADILALMGRVRQIVFERFEVNLESEVIVIGN